MKPTYNRDAVITTESFTLDIDPKALDEINNALRPNVFKIPPQGYYSIQQLMTVMNMSKSQICRRIKELKVENRIDEIKGLKNFSDRSIAIPYYKFLTTSKKPVKNSTK